MTDYTFYRNLISTKLDIDKLIERKEMSKKSIKEVTECDIEKIPDGVEFECNVEDFVIKARTTKCEIVYDYSDIINMVIGNADGLILNTLYLEEHIRNIDDTCYITYDGAIGIIEQQECETLKKYNMINILNHVTDVVQYAIYRLYM